MMVEIPSGLKKNIEEKSLHRHRDFMEAVRICSAHSQAEVHPAFATSFRPSDVIVTTATPSKPRKITAAMDGDHRHTVAKKALVAVERPPFRIGKRDNNIPSNTSASHVRAERSEPKNSTAPTFRRNARVHKLGRLSALCACGLRPGADEGANDR